ncbi:phosphate ABC transporter substrate-binding protein [Blastopirellula sp. J2-11]|uniref:PstS family phosphate ABC transporter substrate-binding protein n=1 Tax=Blastopirellula sp. J2-11 TaxID=2943192 RepID=UPI0021C7B439|nr:phosphate ABC transporter substrate-binding protein [Blastopirellula sp. J2-11]UUO07270.1 phosphate ABC transporter substrate-binding protein [Blastopirellula sp. J2-11]
MIRCRNFFLVAALALTAPLAASAQVQVDENLPSYKPVQGVNGNISSMGSDTMNNLMTLWAEGFQKFYPGVTIEIEGKGSSTAPAALTKGTATFGPMSRPMKEDEIDAFEKAYGYKPTQLGTSIDMLAVFVHKDNPIKGLSLEQLDAVFSSTRKGGGKADITTWGQLGLEGAWANRAISLYGRNSASGTYGYFKENALFKGDYKTSVKEQPGSSAVIQGVANDQAGIGYSGIGYKTAAVRVVPLSKTGTDYVEPSMETVSSYPLSRFLYLSVNHKPGSQLDPLRLEFIKYIFSKEGQEAVVKDGYLPLNAKVATRQLEMILKK